MIFLLACQSSEHDSAIQKNKTSDPWVLERMEQREGDPAKGYEYLLYGGYIGSGVPKDIFYQFFGTSSSNILDREGESANIPLPFNLFETPNGVEVIGGINCFGCHSSSLNGDLVIGLGNAFNDYTRDDGSAYTALSVLIKNTYGEDSAEWESYYRLGESSEIIGPHIVLPFYGINPAMALEEAAVSQRDPETLLLQSNSVFDVTSQTIGSDVPPWWHVKKKNALYYNAVGRGDFSRLIMQICVVGVWNTEHASQIDSNFPDVLAYLESIEPPVYPNEIDETEAEQGAAIFAQHCSDCHGTYHVDPNQETYPNKLIPVEVVGTDPYLAQGYQQNPGFLEWLQTSWFTKGEQSAYFVGVDGYIAPPLDGIWATAPYFHNGSVPNLEQLLNSQIRAPYWKRNFGSSAYDMENVGWPVESVTAEEYESLTQEEKYSVYNTTLDGYSNQGHTYGDILSDEERKSLLVYLKKL
jgi:mono/diheme cytochrome c family protein